MKDDFGFLFGIYINQRRLHYSKNICVLVCMDFIGCGRADDQVLVVNLHPYSMLEFASKLHIRRSKSNPSLSAGFRPKHSMISTIGTSSIRIKPILAMT